MDPSDFPLVSFRVIYKAFAAVPDDEIFIIALEALNYFSPCRGVCTNSAWMLVVAHMLDLNGRIADGESPTGVVTSVTTVSYTHLRAHETGRNLVCRLLLEKKKKKKHKHEKKKISKTT